MATFESNFGSFKIRLEVWEESYSVANNTSYVRRRLTLIRTSGSAYGTADWSVNVAGQGASGSAAYNISTSSSKVFIDDGITVGHNADGTASVYGEGWIDTGQGSGSVGGTLALTTIPRNSQVTVDKTSYNLGDPIVVTTNRKATSFTHRIRFRQNNASGTLIKEITNVGASTTWTPTSGEIATMQGLIPNSNTLTLYVESYNNQVGAASSLTRPLNLTDANPTFTAFNYKDNNATVAAITGNNQVLVQGQSQLLATVTAAQKMVAQKSATPNQYNFQFGDVNVLSSYSASADVTGALGVPAVDGTQRLTVKAFDSRNNFTSVYKDVVVVPYAVPVIDAGVSREGGFEDQTTLSIAGSFSLVQVNGTTKNAVNASSGVKYRFKRSDTTMWGSWVNVTATISGSGISVADILMNCDNDYQWDFEVSITDKFGTVIAPLTLSVGKPIVHIGKDRQVGINKVADNGDLDVAGDIYSNGQKVGGCPFPVGAIYMSVSPNDPSTIWAGTTWVVWGAGRTIVGVDPTQTEFDTVEEVGGSKTVTLSVAQTPAHQHRMGWTNEGAAGSGYGTLMRPDTQSTPYNYYSAATGGGGAHTNLQPYITTYLWKRIA
jgi:hypothetical protein